MSTINLTLQSEESFGRFEELAGHSRVRRVGDYIMIGGTASVGRDGTLHAPFDIYEQTKFIYRRFETLLERAGGSLADIVRIRMYYADPAEVDGWTRAHKEIFDEIRPVCTGIGVKLWEPGMRIEMDCEAIVQS